jgi:choline dehydrogenase-like flavoprotein
MLLDANAVEDGTVVEADVCVIGAGAAGITLALTLARAGVDVCVLESGGLQPDPATQALHAPENRLPGYPLQASRVHALGGSTFHWGGLCRPLDPDDFLQHAWVELSGWPISRADLDPWYVRALPILDIPRAWTLAETDRDLATHPRLMGSVNASFQPILWLESPPTRFAPKYRGDLETADRIRCLLHATVTEVVPNADGTIVERVEARTPGGRRLRCRARRYVLAGGGLGNAQLLLSSDSVVRGGLGNGHDLVGRCFMDHPNQFVGSMVAVAPAAGPSYQEEYMFARRTEGGLRGIWRGFFGFSTTPDVRAQHRLLACAVNLHPAGEPAVGDTAAIEELLAAGRPGRPARRFWLSVLAEQSPNPESRILLGEERDAFGRRKAVADLRLRPADVRSVEKSVRLFALETARLGHARVRIFDVERPSWHLLAGHHSGTTRMADDPRAGVTDRDGRVHGIANLWVAGSSLFPTGGFVNPTLTIVALTLRLANRLGTASTA